MTSDAKKLFRISLNSSGTTYIDVYLKKSEEMLVKRLCQLSEKYALSDIMPIMSVVEIQGEEPKHNG